MTGKLGWKITTLIVICMGLLIVTLTILLQHRANKLKTPANASLSIPKKAASIHQKQVTKKSTSTWHKVIVQKNDNLATIFDRLKIKQSDLLLAVKDHKKLAILHPGEILYLQTDAEHQLQGLKYPLDSIKSLQLTREGDRFVSKVNQKPETVTLSFKSAVIHHSLIHAAKRAGLTRKLVKQLETIFGGSINFARDIRVGDSFSILYQEYYVDGKKIRNGNIIVAEFTNRGKTYKALRYTYPTNHSGYYTPNGHGVEPRFLRAPLHYDHISSRFSYRRMDPVIHKIHSHLGVDFAANAGTPIKSIGDGRIVFIGRDAGYGNAIKIQYGRHYKALYGHMRRFAKNMKLHHYVHKGEVIGYVGETGWATGPHLHFGFFINGVAKDWLAIKMPTGASIPQSYLTRFAAASKRMMAELQLYQDTELAANNTKSPAAKSSF
ncbi:peptidoglycan DD-metalloendopeptidase family protein [Candidiatus Paracoxiella cheracis]|uniref:peptidoglycan DD-metalloendopeptidase family protein n=1 Tax=Candidiatus Paracoxiella cheracis TaxID=3405120 RepID=UPI003BF51AAB